MILFAGALHSAWAKTVSIKILTPITKGRPTEVVPIQYEVEAHSETPTRTGKASAEPPTYWESPFPGMVPVKMKSGAGKKIFKQESGMLFEETEVLLLDNKKKRVFQRVVYGGPHVVSGDCQELQPASRMELGKYFAENFRMGKNVEDYARAVFVLQTQDERETKFDLPCRFVKTNRQDLLEKVQIKKEILELLLAGACP